MLIVAGVQFTDLNTGLFSQQITRDRTIEIGAVSASVGEQSFAPLELPDALRGAGPGWSPRLAGDRPAARGSRSPAEPPAVRTRRTALLSQAALWIGRGRLPAAG